MFGLMSDSTLFSPILEVQILGSVQKHSSRISDLVPPVPTDDAIHALDSAITSRITVAIMTASSDE